MFLFRRQVPPDPLTADEDPPEETFVEMLLDEGREELARADNKASVMLGAAGLVLSVFLGSVIAGDWDPTQIGNGPAEATFWLGIALSVLGIVRLAAAVMPRTRHGEAREKLVYFGHVIQYRKPGLAVRQSTRRRREAEAKEELRGAIVAAGANRFERTVDQVWVISLIVQRKYRHVRAGLLLLGLSSALCVVALVVDLWRR
jgi:hypothetical protein